jgi:hypothetical protein
MASQATPEIRTRPIGGQQPTSHWNSPKRQRTASFSDRGWEVTCEIADLNATNRSEVIEVAVRLLKQRLDNGESFQALRNDVLEM